ncbi:MAG: ADP-ribosylglycohydrolase family protein [Steroidobacteraceae bacterium]
MKPPLPNSYWVVPGRLLAGEHPEGKGAASTRARLAALLEAGVRGFIDLTESHEMPAYRGLLPAGVQYQNFPMPDHALPTSPQQMRAIQDALQTGLQAGMVYVHCRAGIGRTGVTIGCYLREQGRAAQGALDELNRVWQQNARAAQWPSIPETEEQEHYVRHWEPRVAQLPESAGAASEDRDARAVQRYRGCLMGLALGDALSAAPAMAAPLGWTDDTGTTLCVVESLLACQGFDGRDQLNRIRLWSQNPAAAGALPRAVLHPVVRSVLTRAVWNRAGILGSHDPTHLDASPLARSAAAAVYAAGQAAAVQELAADITRVTHQAPLVVDACRLLAAMIALALGGRGRAVILGAPHRFAATPLRSDIMELADEWVTPRVGRRKPHRGVLGALDRAVRSFARSRDFADGMQTALSARTDDRDAVCAAYGALAGAYYGDGLLGFDRLRPDGLERVGRLAEQVLEHRSVTNAIA